MRKLLIAEATIGILVFIVMFLVGTAAYAKAIPASQTRERKPVTVSKAVSGIYVEKNVKNSVERNR